MKNKLANFKLHLARVVTSEILKKAIYLPEDIKSIDIDTINNTMFFNCAQLLSDVISDFQKENSEANYINMAKTKGFTDKIIEKLNTRFL